MPVNMSFWVAKPAGVDDRDLCLATLTTKETTTTSADGETTSSSTDEHWECVDDALVMKEQDVYHGVTNHFSVYTVVLRPRHIPPPPNTLIDFWEAYGVYFWVGLSVFLVLAAGAGWAIWRLNRYRAKWKEVKKRMKDTEGDGFALAGMFGGGGMDDGEIEMQANPGFQDATQLQMQQLSLRNPENDLLKADLSAAEIANRKLMEEHRKLKMKVQRQEKTKKSRKKDGKRKKKELGQVQMDSGRG